MKTFTNLIDMLKDFESFTPAAKINPLDGNWELGYGQTGEFLGKKIVQYMTCTEEEAVKVLDHELKTLWDFLVHKDLHLTKHPLHALISILYNMGKNGAPKLLMLCHMDDYNKARSEFLDGIYCENKPVLGLLSRRISEYRLFTTGVYCRLEEGDPITPEELELLLRMNAHNADAIDMINSLEVEK